MTKISQCILINQPAMVEPKWWDEDCQAARDEHLGYLCTDGVHITLQTRLIYVLVYIYIYIE